VKGRFGAGDQERPEATLVFFDLGGAQDRLAIIPVQSGQRERCRRRS
jgi:DNA polymerase-1